MELDYSDMERCLFTVDDSIGWVAYRSAPSRRHYEDFGDISGIQVNVLHTYGEFACISPVSSDYFSSRWGYVPTAALVAHEPPKDINYAQYSENDVLLMCKRYIAYKDNLPSLPDNVVIETVDGFYVTCWYYLDMPDHVSTLGRYTIDTRTGMGTDEWSNETIDYTLY